MAPSTPTKPRALLVQRSRALWKLIETRWKRIHLAAGTLLTRWLRGSPAEKPEVILPPTWKPMLWKLAVHVIPVLATIPICYLNFVGYFIGNTLVGSISATAQSTTRLAVQEVFVIMSLSVIIMDEVRHKLMFEKTGLPLGLLLSHTRFSDIMFLKSHEFRACWPALSHVRDQSLLYLLIITCSLVALFIGPASAILMTPTWYTDWPAGGASFYLNGDLNPTRLDNDSIGNRQCLSHRDDPSVLDAIDWAYASCPWAGYPYLKKYFEVPRVGASHHIQYSYDTFVQDLSILWADGVDIVYTVETVRTYAVASNIAIAAFARQIANLDWAHSIYDSQETTTAGGSKGRYRFAQQNETTASVRGYVPVVRTQCFVAEWHLPVIALEPLDSNEQYLPFPVMPDFSGGRGRAHYIPVAIFNETYTATQWIKPPSYPTMTNDGSDSFNYPTVFLVIRNPPWYTTLDYYTDITCSVSAAWVPGTHVTDSIAYEGATTQRGVVDQHHLSLLQKWMRDPWADHDLGPPPKFEEPTTWRGISMTPDWLNVLTPDLEPELPGWTTMAAVLETVLGQVDAEWPQYTAYNLFPDSPIFERVTSVITSFVADGLSRVGWEENFAYNLQHDTVFSSGAGGNGTLPGWNYGCDSWDDVWSGLIRNNIQLMPNSPYKHSSGSMHQLQVKITGYGMRADDVAYQLAIVVLFVYLALIACHISVVVYKRHSSTSWSSLTDLLVLAQVSSPPNSVLENTCTGVQTHDTLRLPVRIRVPKGAVPGQEAVQLAFDSTTGDLIKRGRDYGIR